MPIGVVGYTVRFHTFTAEQIESTYQKIAALGYDGVENGLGGRVLGVERDLELLKKYNLRVADAYYDITKPDEAMAHASQYGVKILGINSIPGEMMATADGFYAYAQRMNEMAKPFRGTGFRLQYHNHTQEFRNFPELGGKSGMQILIEETDPETICYELDTHWLTGAGCDPAQWIRRVKGRIPIVHFKDYAVDAMAEDTGLGYIPKRFAEVGRGNINWPPIVEACREAGVEWTCVEQDRSQLDVFESLRISLESIKALGVK